MDIEELKNHFSGIELFRLTVRQISARLVHQKKRVKIISFSFEFFFYFFNQFYSRLS